MITNKFSSILFDNTYTETLHLLTKSESFLRHYSSKRAQEPDQVRDLRVNCEMTRVTARLTQVMAWLLAQKASLAGEISPQEACSEKFLIKEDPFCLSHSINGQEDDYPLPIRELLVESLGLYKRVLTLSHQMNKTTSSDQNSRTLN